MSQFGANYFLHQKSGEEGLGRAVEGGEFKYDIFDTL
jgi:hypothetical protein